MHIFLTIVFIIVSIVLTILVLMQEGKSAGLSGAISGVADTYWGKNKGRSMEGQLEKATKILAVAFFLLAILIEVF
jgi:preprotein translocase subunit SecG